MPGHPAELQPRLTDGSQDKIVAAFSKLSVKDDEIPLRPGFGQNGQAIKVRTNFFPMKVPPGPLGEYDIHITPAVENKRMKRRIFQLAEGTAEWAAAGLTGKVAHDHASKLISSVRLPQPLKIHVPYSDEDDHDDPKPTSKKGRTSEYVLQFNYIQDLETSSLIHYLNGNPEYRNYDVMPVVTALNLVLMAFPTRSGSQGVMVGRNKFFHPDPNKPPVSLSGGLEAWRGFYSSVRPAHRQLMVNVNACTTAFYVRGNLAERLTEFLSMGYTSRPAAFVKGLRVKTHLGFRKTIRNAGTDTPQYATFTPDDGVKISVADYFQKKWNIRLRYPDLPVVDIGSGKRQNLIPPELCEIVESQPFKGKLLDDHTAEMIKVACQPPNVNGAAIVERGLPDLGISPNAATLVAFKIAIGTEMSVVPARILPPPSICYGKGVPKVDERASWNLRDVKFAKGAKLVQWAVLVIKDGNPRDEFSQDNEGELRQIVKDFAQMCSKSGMTVEDYQPPIVWAHLPKRERSDPTRKATMSHLRTVLTSHKPKPKMILIMLSSGDKHVYAGIKHLCDVYLDVTTVCVQSSKIKKGQPQYYANVALKVNMKMGGVNHVLDQKNLTWLKKQPTMLVGMDVTHPGPGTIKGTPSIAAVVASVDQHFGQFPASLRLQESKKEMITHLAAMMAERIATFKARSGVLPQRIIVYRDGVSEGQFDTVVREELPEIQKAFTKFKTASANYSPTLTIVICGKRHHTRFYPTETGHADKDGNPRPGTVVDRGVTAIYEFDFFLQAHGGLQGTTRPTHYYVVHDENKFTADLLQTLTNDVSYMFARATKAVSLASPAYYADIACERGRCYIHALLQGISELGGTTGESGKGETEVITEAEKMWKNGVGPLVRETMFYL